MKKSTLSSARRCRAGHPRFPANMQLRVFGNHLLAQNHDTARFITVPGVYTASQARYHAHFLKTGHKPAAFSQPQHP
ncbi:hypothetical protein LK542_05275 [Massilia sp. IC2-477]|uniref:hypothetical protein n=1 Tax=unclassified Massilia TaxID=2609279 RepID=UPI001D12AE4B|nr:MULTISPECIES: hypothetical protein [unclassified Massilia]MCC2955028.1 hypothetical protein [Massilia sp. IC2-477]MCC2973022.1 hypothetical protein [Massilia sp. IC2-476]